MAERIRARLEGETNEEYVAYQQRFFEDRAERARNSNRRKPTRAERRAAREEDEREIRAAQNEEDIAKAEAFYNSEAGKAFLKDAIESRNNAGLWSRFRGTFDPRGEKIRAELVQRSADIFTRRRLNNEESNPSAPTTGTAVPPPPPPKLSDFLDDDQTKPFEGFDASNYEDRPGGPQETRSAGTFSIQEFRTNITSVGDNILPTHSFLVTFPRMNWINSTLKKMNIERYLTMRCETVIAPVMSFLQENIVRRYGYGPLENVPYGVNSQEFTLQFIVDRNSLIPEFFEQWMNFIINRDSFGGANMLNTQNERDPYEVQYKDNYVAPMINIQVYDRKQINVMSYKIYDAFPNNIQSINLNWSDADQLMRLNVSFSFTDFRLVTQYKVAEGPPKEKVTLNDGPKIIPQETLEQVELPQIGTLYISGDDEQAPGSQDATASSGPEDIPPVSPTPSVSIRNFNGGAVN